MLALGQAVDCITVNESMVCNLPGARRMVAGRIVYIHRRNRWLLVEYRGAHGEALREGYSFYDVGRVVFAKKAKKRKR